MPDKRTNRGPHPKDKELFAPEMVDVLRSAGSDLAWLLSRGYARTSSLKLVGDRHGLRERQRMALNRTVCSDQELELRMEKRIAPSDVVGETVNIDGFNMITTIEAALSGGLLIRCRDGCVRDLASMHGNYRKVDQTLDAARLIGNALEDLRASRCNWYLDKPVSNSGRLKALLDEVANENGLDWEIDLVYSPDKVLKKSPEIAISGDSIILNECESWLDLTSIVLSRGFGSCWLIDLS